MEVFKPSLNILTKESKFIELADSDGWTDCFIADLTNLSKDFMRANAITHKSEIVDRKPNIKAVIPTSEEHEVEKIEFDLKSKTAVLENSTIKAKVNPKFIGYFVKAYESTHLPIELKLTGEFTPVKVYLQGGLIGLIMPIKAGY